MVKGKSSKSWREKLEREMKPKLVEIPGQWAQRVGHGKMLVPTPLLIDKTINKIPKGKLATVNTIRNYLANAFKADLTCPLTTGIFINIAANTAEEDKSKGAIKITPYWRVIKEGGSLNPKFPGGVKQQAVYLKQEGFEIAEGETNNRFFVKDFEKNLAQLP